MAKRQVKTTHIISNAISTRLSQILLQIIYIMNIFCSNPVKSRSRNLKKCFIYFEFIKPAKSGKDKWNNTVVVIKIVIRSRNNLFCTFSQHLILNKYYRLLQPWFSIIKNNSPEGLLLKYIPTKKKFGRRAKTRRISLIEKRSGAQKLERAKQYVSFKPRTTPPGGRRVNF